MQATEALRLAEGELGGAGTNGGERVLIDLVEKSTFNPAAMNPRDLEPAIREYGRAGTLEIVSMLGSFHFINRIADFVGIQSDLPVVQPRVAWLRRAGVRMQGWLMGRMLDLSNREADVDVDAALERADRVLGPLPPGYADLKDAPNVAAFLTTIADVAQHIDPDLIARVTPVVAEALPTCADDATGLHPRPSDPIDALAFVGTRYVVRTTDAMIDAIRDAYGFSDAELTDLFYAVSMRNAFERMDRVLAEPLVDARRADDAGVVDAPGREEAIAARA